MRNTTADRDGNSGLMEWVSGKARHTLPVGLAKKKKKSWLSKKSAERGYGRWNGWWGGRAGHN